MKRHKLSLILSIAAFAVGFLPSGSSAHVSGRIALAAPAVMDATPRDVPSDTNEGGFARVTFSPDGDSRDDVVSVRVRSTPGDRLVLEVHPSSSPNETETEEQEARSGFATLTWDGLELNGKPRAPGSYVIRACSVTSQRCSATRVLAHLRILSVFTPRATAASVGETIPVFIESDRAGPYTLDLAPAMNPSAPGVGTIVVNEPGRVPYVVPPVAGGLWILRATNGRTVTQFPLVIHEQSIGIDNPPPGSALVVHPYITWRAYDRADLNRDGEVDTWYAHPLRPVVPLTGLFEQVRREPSRSGREASPRHQQAFSHWLTMHRLIAQHVTDVELGRMPLSLLRRYAVIVFPGHTEYYERATYDRVLAYRNGGGRLYFLSGNSFYGEVKIDRSRIIRRSYRYRTPARSDFRLAATGFRSCCWPTSITPRYRLAAGVRERLPWLLEGTGLRDGDAFGIAAGEVDTVDSALSPPGTIRIASATVPPYLGVGEGHAYAWIGTHRFSHEPAGVRARRVDIAYAATGAGEVFSWGNTGFLASLFDNSLPAEERTALDQVALNVWRRFTR